MRAPDSAASLASFVSCSRFDCLSSPGAYCAICYVDHVVVPFWAWGAGILSIFAEHHGVTEDSADEYRTGRDERAGERTGGVDHHAGHDGRRDSEQIRHEIDDAAERPGVSLPAR